MGQQFFPATDSVSGNHYPDIRKGFQDLFHCSIPFFHHGIGEVAQSLRIDRTDQAATEKDLSLRHPYRDVVKGMAGAEKPAYQGLAVEMEMERIGKAC